MPLEPNERVMGRTATGVRGMTLDPDPDDAVIGMICMRVTATDDVLVVSEQGMGKRSQLADYRVTNRGGKGVKTINITERTGKLIAIKNVNDDNDLVIINKSGIMIRLNVRSLRIVGRATQGVRLINLEKKNDQIASVCKVTSEPEATDETNLADAFNEPDVDIPNIDNPTDTADDNNADGQTEQDENQA